MFCCGTYQQWTAEGELNTLTKRIERQLINTNEQILYCQVWNNRRATAVQIADHVNERKGRNMSQHRFLLCWDYAFASQINQYQSTKVYPISTWVSKIDYVSTEEGHMTW